MTLALGRSRWLLDSLDEPRGQQRALAGAGEGGCPAAPRLRSSAPL